MAFDPWLLVSNRPANGEVAVNAFGINLSVGTTRVPIAPGGIWRMPTPSNAVSLRVRAGNANDAPGGTGARSVLLSGIDQNGDRVAEVVDTGGASAGPLSSTTFMRLNEALVYQSGTYSTGVPTATHAATLTIESSAGTEWGRIVRNNNTSRGRSQIAAFSVPRGYNLYIIDVGFSSSSSGAVDIIGMARPGNNIETAPYLPFLSFFEKRDIATATEFSAQPPYGPFPGRTDVMFTARAKSSTREVALNFDAVMRKEAPFTDINGISIDDVLGI